VGARGGSSERWCAGREVAIRLKWGTIVVKDDVVMI